MPDIQKEQGSPFIDNKHLYGKEIKSTPTPQKEIGVDTDKTIFDNIINAGMSNNLDMSALDAFTQVSQSRDQIYALMDMMCEDPTVASAIELYAEDATEYNQAGQIVWCESNDGDVSKYVQYLLDSMNIDKNAYSHMISLIKYGDLYLRLYRKSDYIKDTLFETKENIKQTLNEDVKIKAYSENDHYVHYLEKEPNPAEIFELTKFGKSYAYVKADINSYQNQPTPAGSIINTNTFRWQFNKNDVTLFDATNFVHAALEDNSSRTPEEVNIIRDNADDKSTQSLNYIVRRGQPLLYSLYKIWRLMKLLENSMILNRVTKSSIVRVVGVEVGDMPKEMVAPHLQGIKSMMEQKTALKDDQYVQEYTNPGPVENNIYVPTRNGLGALNIQAIGGDTNVTGLADVDYFKKLFYGALGIPKQYLGDTDDATGFNGGTALSIVSSRYAKRIKRLQNTYCQALTDAINLMLLDAGLNSYVNKFTIRMQAPTTQEEVDRKDAIAGEVQLVSDIMNLLNDLENSLLKLKILKEMLANVVTEPEVIALLEEEIEKLEKETNPEENTDNEDDFSEFDSGDEDININLSSDTGLDQALDLETPETEVEEPEVEIPEEETSLPSPDELGIGDLTDNNNPEV